MTSLNMRTNPLFMRNAFEGEGRWGICVVKKQDVALNRIFLISFSQTKPRDSIENRSCGVHFFCDDYRFQNIYNNPLRTLKKLSQYAFLLTPDFSLYADMPAWRQLQSVAHNRWCGAYWQSKGLNVIPTISWSNAQSFCYCFDGIEKHAIVAVGMVGCRRDRQAFLRGYNAMLERLEPDAILCYGRPFPEMNGNIIPIDYTFCGRRKK